MKLAIIFDIGDEDLVDEILESLDDENDMYEALADLCKGEYNFEARKVDDQQ